MDTPLKITRQENGSYSWSCPIDVEYHKRSIKPGLYACIGIALFLLLFGGLLSYQYRDMNSFLIVAASDAVFLLIAFLLFGLALSAKEPSESYVMTETYVKSGYGKSSVYFDFRKAEEAVFNGRYIELKGRRRKIRLYMPAEDYDFVKEFILYRLPGECRFL